MVSQKTPFLFPHQSVVFLSESREEGQWASLVERIADLPETNCDSLAFQLMMIRICGCMRCTTYKANLGCTTCAQRAVRNSKSTTNSMLTSFIKAQEEVRSFLDTRPRETTQLPTVKAA